MGFKKVFLTGVLNVPIFDSFLASAKNGVPACLIKHTVVMFLAPLPRYFQYQPLHFHAVSFCFLSVIFHVFCHSSSFFLTRLGLLFIIRLYVLLALFHFRDVCFSTPVLFDRERSSGGRFVRNHCEERNLLFQVRR